MPRGGGVSAKDPLVARLARGKDKSLRGPLYKPAMQMAPASAAESANLVGTLRSLLGSEGEQ